MFAISAAATSLNFVRIKPGIEFGTDLFNENGVWFRPSLRLGVNGLLSGDNSVLSAGFDGAPAGIGAFRIGTRSDSVMGELNGGFELVDGQGLSAKFGYFGQFCETTRQQGLSLKITMPL